MKYIFFALFLFTYSFSAFCQHSRSETVKLVSYYTIKGDRLERTDSVVLQINERMGDHDAEIFIPYSKGDKVSVGDAWIEDAKGNIVRRLKNKEIQDRSAISDISLYEDDFIKSFELKHNTYPYRIVYSYKIVYSKFLSAAALNYRNSRRPIKEGLLVVETSSDRPIKYKQENAEEPEIETLANTIRYKWKYNYAPYKATEKNASSNTSDAPIIHVVPLNFKYGAAGSFDTWKTFGDWIFNLNKNKGALLDTEEQKINIMLSEVTDDMEKSKTLYQYLQNQTRYINVSVNLGGFQTYPASYVCTNKYGDCKALTNYMQAMLKYAGINSYYTLINSGDKVIDTDVSFPAQVFNHVILTVPFGKDTVYLECTSNNTPFGYISTAIQGREALIVDENNSHFVTIPGLGPQDVLCTRKFNINLGTSDVKLYATERGYNYELSSYLTSDIDKNSADKYIRNSILTGSFDLLDYKFDKAEKDSAFIKLEANCKIHNLYKEYGKNILLTPFPIDIDNYEAPDKRISDVQLDYPQYYKDTIIYNLSDRKISKKPENIMLESEFGSYSLKYEEKDGRLFIYKTILIHAGRYTQDKYKDFYQFIASIRNNEIKNYFFETI